MEGWRLRAKPSIPPRSHDVYSFQRTKFHRYLVPAMPARNSSRLRGAVRVQRREIGGRSSCLRRLLEGVGEAEQDGLAPGPASKGGAVTVTRGGVVAGSGDE